jgi:hypothetical protein
MFLVIIIVVFVKEEIYLLLWFYYCANCIFFAHSKCVLVDYLFIKFGAIYIQI